MRVKDGQPKIQFQTFADMINFPVKPGEQPETIQVRQGEGGARRERPCHRL